MIKNKIDNFLVSTGFTTLTVDKTQAKPEFIYYYLTQKYITESLQTIAEQSTTSYPSIKPSDIGNLLIELPPLEIQEKISQILTSIENKITVNKEINKNLHLLSKNIFKYYMEDFCPFLENGMQNSELGNIPIDWKVHDFNSIADIFNGYSYKGNELQPSNSAMATIKNFNRDGSFRSDGFKEIVYQVDSCAGFVNNW